MRDTDCPYIKCTLVNCTLVILHTRKISPALVKRVRFLFQLSLDAESAKLAHNRKHRDYLVVGVVLVGTTKPANFLLESRMSNM